MPSISRLALAGVLFFSMAAAAPAAMLKVPVSLRTTLPADQKAMNATCKLTPVGDHAANVRPMPVAPLQVPGLGGFDLPDGTWMVEVTAPGYWHPPVVVQLKGHDETAEFKLWPTAKIHGTIKLKAGEEQPKELLVRFQSSPSVAVSERLPVTQIKCPIQDAVWSCEVPAGLLDLRFRARHYMTEFRWKFALTPGETRDVGAFALRRGSSVIGTTQVAPGVKAAAPETRVILEPRTFSAPAEDRGRESMHLLATAADERGFFSIEGVPPGEYTIVAQQKDLNSVPQTVRVLQDTELELLDPLILQPPRKVTLHVTPEIDPAGKPWRVLLFADRGAGGHVDVIAQDTLTREGAWHHEGLRGSHYTVQLQAAGGARWLTREIDLPDDSNELTLDIPIVKVSGTIKLGERPLAASAHFGGEFGSTSVALDSDEKGNFRGVLPKNDEPWREVTVISSNPSIHRTLRDVKVQAPADRDEAKLDLILPSTYVVGSVVDPEGHPVTHAMVNVQGAAHEPLIQVPVEKDGSFAIYGLSTGTVTLQAMAFMQESKPVDVVLNDTDTARVNLILQSNGVLAGRIVSNLGVVAGARVSATPTDAQPLLTVPVSTDVDGQFACALAAGAREIDLTVEAPGYAYKMFHLIVPDKPIDIPVDQAGGTIIADVPPFDGDDPSSLPFLVHAGARHALPYIGRPTFQKTDHGYRIRVAMLERGEYQVCIGNTQRCASGFLPPLGELSLAIPSN